MTIYTIANQKGGVAKTTTAAALAAGLKRSGARVLAIDMDPQCNLSYAYNADMTGITHPSIMHALTGKAAATDAIQHTDTGDIIASSYSLATIETALTDIGKEYRLREALAPIAGQYDACVIDTPPTLGLLTINALTAGTAVIIPTTATISALQGIASLWQTISAVKQYTNPRLTVAGILVTRYEPRKKSTKTIDAMLDQSAAAMHTEIFRTRIRNCNALEDAIQHQQSIYEESPRSNAALDYAAFCDELTNSTKG